VLTVRFEYIFYRQAYVDNISFLNLQDLKLPARGTPHQMISLEHSTTLPQIKWAVQLMLLTQLFLPELGVKMPRHHQIKLLLRVRRKRQSLLQLFHGTHSKAVLTQLEL
jgi:hypothetical protein